MSYYCAQIVALLAFIVLLLSFWQKKRKRILFFQIISSIFYTIQYALLLAFSGAAVNIVGIIRASLFRKYNKKNMLYLFIMLYIIIGIIFWQGYISLLPILASIIYTYVLFQKNENDIRKETIVVSLIWVCYNFIVNAHAAMITEIILIISNVFAIIKYKK